MVEVNVVAPSAGFTADHIGTEGVMFHLGVRYVGTVTEVEPLPDDDWWRDFGHACLVTVEVPE